MQCDFDARWKSECHHPPSSKLQPKRAAPVPDLSRTPRRENNLPNARTLIDHEPFRSQRTQPSVH